MNMKWLKRRKWHGKSVLGIFQGLPISETEEIVCKGVWKLKNWCERWLQRKCRRGPTYMSSVCVCMRACVCLCLIYITMPVRQTVCVCIVMMMILVYSYNRDTLDITVCPDMTVAVDWALKTNNLGSWEVVHEAWKQSLNLICSVWMNADFTRIALKDRVPLSWKEWFWYVFMGLVCHTHKYDTLGSLAW